MGVIKETSYAGKLDLRITLGGTVSQLYIVVKDGLPMRSRDPLAEQKHI